MIIYIDPEALLNADEAVDELLALEEQKRKQKSEVSEEELIQFLEKHRLLLSEEAKKNIEVIRENEEMQKLLDQKEKALDEIKESRKEPIEGIIKKADSDPDMLSLIRRAIKDGFTDDEIRIITDKDLNEEKRSELYEAIRLRR